MSEDNIKINLGKIGCESVGRIQLHQNCGLRWDIPEESNLNSA